jgi:hypothetical protein
LVRQQHTDQHTDELPLVEVELFGMPRVVAGRSLALASGVDLRGILTDLVDQIPDLGPHILDSEQQWLNAGYTFVVDGSFTNDPSLAVGTNSQVLLVSRASGG